MSEQPKPIPNKHPAAWDLVKADIDARDAGGEKKYGVRLQPFNGRDMLLDMYEESLDRIVYLRAYIEEVRLKNLAAAPATDSRDEAQAIPFVATGFYRHFKGGIYFCLGVGRDSERYNNFVVTYLSLKKKELFTRPYLSPPELPDEQRCGFTDFVVKAEYRGKRFTRILLQDIEPGWLHDVADFFRNTIGHLPPDMLELVRERLLG